jgi:hypothetical protein
VRSLTKLVTEEISLELSVEDFKTFFKVKQKKTFSSPYGRHMGHYKTILEDIRRKNYAMTQIIIDIAHIALITASPLNQWKRAFQVMLDKGKGQFVNNL